MATTATDLEQAARWFHALSDPTRLGILRLLSWGERCVCDLTSALDASQPRLSFHLKVLKTAGLVRDRRDGRWVHYRLDGDALDGIAAFVADARPVPTPDGWDGAGGCCG